MPHCLWLCHWERTVIIWVVTRCHLWTGHLKCEDCVCLPELLLLTSHVLTIWLFPSINWTMETAAACYLLLVTNLTTCEQNKWKRRSEREGAGLCLFGHGNEACSVGLFSCQNRAPTLSRRSGGEGDVCVYLLRKGSGQSQARQSDTSNKHTHRNKNIHSFASLAQPTVCDLNLLQLRD